MPEYSPVQLESFVQSRAPQIAQDIVLAAKNSQNEADLVAQVEKLLDRFTDSFDLQLHLQRERTLVNGRADAVYNRLVIEYEPPRSLNKSNSHRNNQHAIQQVKDYMGGLERLDRHKKERLAGVVLDGGFYIFVRYRDDRWFIDDPLPVTTHSTETFLRYLLSLSTEKALTPENLVRDFGENSNVARQVVPVLYNLACCSSNKKVETIFQQWERQFREISGYDPSSGQLDAAELAKSYAVKVKKPDLERLFFSIHSYYAAFIKLLALQVGHYYLMPKTGTGLKAAANYESSKLCDYLRKLEAGGLFKELGIRNFLEGDFFGWYLEAWDESVASPMSRLVAELADYSLVTLDVDPEDTRDLLKQLYQNLMPKMLRHALGEYYTPDWLAERLLNQLGYDGNPAKRILDPSCGSGTFPVLEIKRARAFVEEKMIPPAQALNMILENIVGYDLNPLAVISARTNYLLALGELLENRKGEITIPIYLCDSIQTPSQGKDLFSQQAYSFLTSVGRFNIPQKLVHSHYIDKLTDLLEECVHQQVTDEIFHKRLLHELPLIEIEDEQEIDIVIDLYNQLSDLERQGINGIWARIIKNAFAPLFQGKFDYVAGNPPWVTWQNLPAEYRNTSVHLWDFYKLFESSNTMERQVSSRVQVDISILLFYVCFDRYLHPNGKLGFIITQSIFQSVIAGRGFRRFKLPNGNEIAVSHVDDLTEMQPFDGATNLTSVIIASGNRPTKYPVSYTLWLRNQKGWQPPTDISLSDILKDTRTVHFVAQPIEKEDLLSAWLIGKEKAIQHLYKCIGKSYYYEFARKGSDTRGANAVYWLSIDHRRPDGNYVVSNLSETGRKGTESIQAAIESTYVYPLLRGRNVKRWSAEPNAYILVPYSRRNASEPISEGILLTNAPKTHDYLKFFENELRKRPKFRNFDPMNDCFYMLYNIGNYSFSEYKVVWREQASTFTASVCGPFNGEVTIPDHKLSMVPVSSEDEAYYLCALLNSSIAQFIVKSYSLGTSTDVHVLNYVACPAFSNRFAIHLTLSALSKKAHMVTREGKTSELDEIEDEIDKLSAQLWQLSEQELTEIQASLAEII